MPGSVKPSGPPAAALSGVAGALCCGVSQQDVRRQHSAAGGLRLVPGTHGPQPRSAASQTPPLHASPITVQRACPLTVDHPHERVGELWLYTLTHQLQQGRKLASASAGQLCELLWALDRFGFHADADWRSVASAAVEEVLRGLVTGASGGSEELAAGALAADSEPGNGLPEAGGPVSPSAELASLLLWAARSGVTPERGAVEVGFATWALPKAPECPLRSNQSCASAGVPGTAVSPTRLAATCPAAPAAHGTGGAEPPAR
jgi:hypothetical protein